MWTWNHSCIVVASLLIQFLCHWTSFRGTDPFHVQFYCDFLLDFCFTAHNLSEMRIHIECTISISIVLESSLRFYHEFMFHWATSLQIPTFFSVYTFHIESYISAIYMLAAYFLFLMSNY